MLREIKKVILENGRDLVLQGASIDRYLEAHDGKLPGELTKLQNYLIQLEVSFTSIKDLPEGIGKLMNLEGLSLRSNQLVRVNKEIAELSKLKYLGLHNNMLQEIPVEFNNLKNLSKLDLSNNYIKEFKNFKDIPLKELYLANNQLSEFPEINRNIVMLDLGTNDISKIPLEIDQYRELTELYLSENAIEVIPKSLADCVALTYLELDFNPLKDLQLLKLIGDSHLSSVLEYIKYHGVGKHESAGNLTAIPEFWKTIDKVLVDEYNQDRNFKIIYLPKVDKIRKHILCCIIKNCQLNQRKLNEVLQSLKYLLESVCNNRKDAMIFMHDLNEINSNSIRYKVGAIKELQIVPLNFNKQSKVSEVLLHLRKKSEDYYRRTKNRLCGAFEYLNLVSDELVYIEDEDGAVLSVPPITRCDSTKISQNTTEILVEVTSPKDQKICRKVMEALVEKMVKLGIGKTKWTLNIEQIKIYDQQNKVVETFPTRQDLMNFAKDEILVETFDNQKSMFKSDGIQTK